MATSPPPAPFDDAPRLPADHGLPALGLLMKLNATLWLSIGAFYLALALIALLSARAGHEGAALTIVAVIIAGMVRGGVHIAAANALVARRSIALKLVRRYIVASLGFTLLAFVALAITLEGRVPFAFLASVAVLSLWWPGLLALLVYRRSVRGMFEAAETFDVNLVPADRSLEGLGVMMTTFAVCFIVLNALGLVAIVAAGVLDQPLGIMAAVSTALFLARSIIHLRAGLVAMRGASPLAFQGSVSRYFVIAFVSVLFFAITCVVGAITGGSGSAILVALGGGLLLMIWPIVVQSFAQQAFIADADLDDEGTIPQGPAPDRGLSAFGYMLVYIGGSSLAWIFAQIALAFPGPIADMMRGPFGPEGGFIDLGAAVTVAVRSAATLAAGAACVTMHHHYERGLHAFAGVWLLSSALEYFVLSPADGGLGTLTSGTTEALMVGFQIMLMVAPPVLAVVMSRRRLPAPDPHTPIRAAAGEA